MKPGSIPSHLPAWSRTKLLVFRFFFVYVLLFILTLSFPHPLIPDLPGLIAPAFERIVKWMGDGLLGLKQPYTTELISDSTGLYIHLLSLAIIAMITTLVWTLFDKKRKEHHRLAYWFRVVITYYLTFHLLVYGFNKIFKWQFYLPEPNTLFTTVGDTWRDLLYWSTMGTSHSYNVFLGLMEILAAILLLFKKTRLIGALTALSILLNVVMVNFSFDISVKIYSCFLLLLSLLIIAPDGKRLYQFFFKNGAGAGNPSSPAFTDQHKKILIILKWLVIAWMFASVLTVYIRSRNFNDDTASRPPFHGAYDIPVFTRNNDTLPPLTTDTIRWQRLFIHRRGYLIIQAMNDQMQDFLFVHDPVKKLWIIEDERTGGVSNLNYQVIDNNNIHLTGKFGVDTVDMQLKKIDLGKLRVMKKEFNWTID